LNEADVSEAEAARSHWASQGRVKFYESQQHWRPFIARRVAAFHPSTVLEFGCNAGRNLVEVQKVVPGAKVVGLDVNGDAVQFGVESYGLELHVAGEEFLAELSDVSVDVAFTVSALDHVPDIGRVFDELTRVTRRALVLLEPFTGRVGRADGNGGDSKGDGGFTPFRFTYSWDYAALTRPLGRAWRWSWTPYPLSSQNIGPYYWLIEGVRQGP
jgi:SAM-dependent methyltransferase